MSNMRQAEGSSRVRWLEVRVQVDGETAEAVNELFGRLGTGGAVLEELVPGDGPDDAIRSYWIKTYMAVHTPEEEAEYRRRVTEGLWHLGQIRPLGKPVFTLLAEQDWAETWKASYQPLTIGRRLVIKPSWSEFEARPEHLVIELDPGQAFGTGLHPSTQLCLLGLEEYLTPGHSVLDLVTGSGILAIAAAKLGAEHVDAMDVEPAAVKAAVENVRANNVDPAVSVFFATLTPFRSASGPDPEVYRQGGHDLVLANIIAEVIAGMATELVELTRPGGVIITSGIILEREHVVLDAFANRAVVIMRSQDGDWVSLTFRVPDGP